MATIDEFMGYLPQISQRQIINTTMAIMVALLGLLVIGYIAFRLLKYKYPVEIWKYDEHGNFQITTDQAALTKRDGVTKVQLAKGKKKQIYNHLMYPIRKGVRGKTKDKFYLTEENGALRGLLLQREAQFFDAHGNFLKPSDIYFEGDKELISLTDADLITKDGAEVYIHPTPVLSPANNDSNNAFSMELMEKVNKYKIPQWYEKLQYAAIIMAGIVAGVIVYIINRSGG